MTIGRLTCSKCGFSMPAPKGVGTMRCPVCGEVMGEKIDELDEPLE